MEKFIPYEKLSKKEKRKIDQARRQTWGELNPVTRKPENSKAYNSNKARNWKRDYHEPVPGLCIYCLVPVIISFSYSLTTLVAILSQNVLSCSTKRIVGWKVKSSSSICILEITSM